MPVMKLFRCRQFFSMDLSGHWSFCEYFDFGCDYGVAVLRQNGDSFLGTLVYTEHIFEEGRFIVSADVKGRILHDQISFECISCQIIDAEEEFEYYTDSRSGTIVEFDRIEGFSDDPQGVEGKFTMIRIG